MMEKPIGHDFASSRQINDSVSAVFDESRVYRVDHYLGKEGVQNLLALRFGNALFEPLWNARHIEQVQITVAETVGLEGRARLLR
jgi:glucose-6-phosphate 1-dehydrogenase